MTVPASMDQVKDWARQVGMVRAAADRWLERQYPVAVPSDVALRLAAIEAQLEKIGNALDHLFQQNLTILDLLPKGFDPDFAEIFDEKAEEEDRAYREEVARGEELARAIREVSR